MIKRPCDLDLDLMTLNTQHTQVLLTTKTMSSGGTVKLDQILFRRAIKQYRVLCCFCL